MLKIKDIDCDEKKTIPLRQRPSISLLLGAGFSVPMGYPTGRKMNQEIQKFDELPIGFCPSGQICKGKDGNKPDFGFTNPYQKRFECCMAIIHEYSKHKAFDYEEFMDFIQGEHVYDDIYQSIGKPYTDNNNYESLVGGMPDIYSQMVNSLLKDTEGNSWYDNIPNHIGDYLEGPRRSYNGFLKFLHSIKDDYVVNVHTLNHDLFFESFNKSDYISGAICDGFEEYHSPFYGILRADKRKYICRLKCYTGRYSGGAIRLYKLHGSIDHAVFHKTEDGCLLPSCEVKLQYGIDPINLLYEKRHGTGYEKDNTYYHADFLTGETSKILQYNSKVFYQKMFRKFRNNLHNAKALIIIGYGGKDKGINDYIQKYFDYEHKPSYIIDSVKDKGKDNDKLKLLADKIHAKKLNIGVDGIKENTFSIR